MKNMLIEGWRGVNHSFALVNQCQILEMLRLPELRLFHRDLPFAMAHWSNLTHSPGFAPADWAQISGLQAPNAEPVDFSKEQTLGACPIGDVGVGHELARRRRLGAS